MNELSVAELKLVAIAQALTEEPRVILIDGAFDGLSDALPKAQRVVRQEAFNGSTLIVASGQASVVAGVANRMVVMEAGRLTASFVAEPADELAPTTIAFTAMDSRVRQIAERVH